MRTAVAANKCGNAFQVLATDRLGIKQALYYGKTGLSIAFGHDDGMAATNSTNICSYIQTYPITGTIYNFHKVTIVGYDDSKQAYLIQNSYSKNFACNGRWWASYELIEYAVYSATGIIWPTQIG